jgi:hypothetical protein
VIDAWSFEMSRLMFGLLIVVGLLAGYPYVNLVLYRMLGTTTVMMTEHDGTQRALVMGPDAPRPDWLPLLPRSVITQAGHWMPSPGREIAGDVEVLTHKGLDDIKRYYLDALGAAGFEMQDAGYGAMTPPIAAYLGVDNILLGYRRDSKLAISVTTRAPGGMMSLSRIVQIHWQTSDKPFHELMRPEAQN